MRLAYVEQGDRSGPTVLLIHAWNESLRSFDRLAPMLPASLHVLAMDQRGHGHADAPDDGYDIAWLGADIEAFMHALDLPSAVLVGSSSGGYVAQQVAVCSPGRVEGLVLVGSPRSLRDPPAFADEIDGLTDPIDAEWVKDFLDNLPRFRDVPSWYLGERVQKASRIPARIWQRSLLGLTSSIPPLETGSISAATLILWGDRDGILSLKDQLALAAEIPGAIMRAYAGVGHLVLWEEPERIASDLLDFLHGEGWIRGPGPAS